MSNKYSLEFLCWVNRCLFPEDFEMDLMELGIEEIVAYSLSNTESFGNIINMYQSYGLKDTKYKVALDSYLTMMKIKWDKIKGEQ